MNSLSTIQWKEITAQYYAIVSFIDVRYKAISLVAGYLNIE